MTQSATVKQDEALLAEIKARDDEWNVDFSGPLGALHVSGKVEFTWPREWAVLDRRTLLRLLSACQARVEEAEKDARELAFLKPLFRDFEKLASALADERIEGAPPALVRWAQRIVVMTPERMARYGHTMTYERPPLGADGGGAKT